MKLKIVNHEVAFCGSGDGRLLRSARHGRAHHGQECQAKHEFEALEHVSPLRVKNLTRIENRSFHEILFATRHLS
jgi:hypothetical protein